MKVASIMFQSREKRAELELEAFVPYSNYPASKVCGKMLINLTKYSLHDFILEYKDIKVRKYEIQNTFLIFILIFISIAIRCIPLRF